MSDDLAVEPYLRSAPADWLVEPFRRHAMLVEETNRNRSSDLLSLRSADGLVAPRTEDGGLGRQVPSAETIARCWVTRPGNLVVNPMWLVGGGIGVTNISGAVSPDYRVYALGSQLYPRYLHYLLRSKPYMDQYRLYTRADTTFDRRVSKNDFHPMPILLPPLDTQRRIADFLDAETARIDGLVRIQNQVLAGLAERRAATVFANISGHERGDRRGATLPWVDTLPHDWLEVRLGLLARMGSGHTPSRSRPEWWENCAIPWITTGEVSQVRDDRREVIYETREQISELGMTNSAATLHPAGTVVLCRTASAGYSAIMGTEMATSQDFVTWTCGPRLDPYYLLWCLRAMRQDLLGRLAMGSTHKTIYVPDLQMLRIPLPPLGEQRQIVTRIRAKNAEIDQLVDTVQQQLELLTERREALITAAVTGQIDVSTASGRGVTEGIMS